MNYQNRLQNLFYAQRAASDPNMRDMWQNKIDRLRKIINTMSIEQAEMTTKEKSDHIFRAIGINRSIVNVYNYKVYIGLYDIDTGNAITFGDLIERWRLK